MLQNWICIKTKYCLLANDVKFLFQFTTAPILKKRNHLHHKYPLILYCTFHPILYKIYIYRLPGPDWSSPKYIYGRYIYIYNNDLVYGKCCFVRVRSHIVLSTVTFIIIAGWNCSCWLITRESTLHCDSWYKFYQYTRRNWFLQSSFTTIKNDMLNETYSVSGWARKCLVRSDAALKIWKKLLTEHMK